MCRWVRNPSRTGATSRAVCPNMVAGGAKIVAKLRADRPVAPFCHFVILSRGVTRTARPNPCAASRSQRGAVPRLSGGGAHTMKIFLAGASGAVGRPLTEMLVAEGHQVIGTTRDPKKAALLRALGATPAIVDALDRD